jgi:guanylate kinase
VTPFILVLSSPSGGGKTTIARRLVGKRSDLGYSISATTRLPRAGEQEGEHYYFVPRDEFMRRVDADAFLEWAEYSGNLYGTLRAEIDRIHQAGRHAVLDIDVQGARQLRGNRAAAVEVFVLPPSAASLADRLVGRNTETTDALRRRLERAAEEILAAGEYDYVIVNDDLDHAVQQVDAIVEAESRRAYRLADLSGTLQELRQAVETEARRYPAVNAGS